MSLNAGNQSLNSKKASNKRQVKERSGKNLKWNTKTEDKPNKTGKIEGDTGQYE